MKDNETKPEVIKELEKKYNIILKEVEIEDDLINYGKENTFLLNKQKEIIGLKIIDAGLTTIPKLESYFHLKYLHLSGNKITEIENLDKLINLTHLDLSYNQISEIKNIDTLINLTHLDLSDNQISEIKSLDTLINLTDLDLNDNQISEIKNIGTLTNLTYLRLSTNQITEIKNLDTLTKLTALDLSANQITEIQNLDTLTKLTALGLNANQITEIQNLDTLTNLTYLYLGYNQITEIQNLDTLINLTYLRLSANQIIEIKNIDALINLTDLDLSTNQIIEIKNIDALINLTDLDLIGNQIIEIKNIDTLTNLTYLRLSTNQITEIKNINTLTNLTYLGLSNNQITKIKNLDTLTKLTALDLSVNQITELKNLEKLPNLSRLYLNSNKISEIKQVNQLSNLKDLYLGNNPLAVTYNIKLESGDNYLPIIQKILAEEKLRQDKLTTATLPVKVLLLGNHAAGKSSFLHYIVHKTLPDANYSNSTHILNIKQCTLKENIVANFYDFGGQDYYHGIYKAFLTNDSINVILWNQNTNKNEKNAPDTNNVGTINFHTNYWLHQLQHYYTYTRKEEESEPILLVQTRADVSEEKRETTNQDTESLNIKNEFFISLNKEVVAQNEKLQAGLAYTKAALIELIAAKTEDKSIPHYEAELINFITSFKNDGRRKTPKSITLEELKAHYPAPEEDRDTFLRTSLNQLCKKGVVLYYPNEPTLEKVAWLNPVLVVEFIYKNILTHQLVQEQQGKVSKQAFEKLFKRGYKKLIDVLITNKVVYLDTTAGQEPTYIIPGYLPLAESDTYHHFLFHDLQKPDIVLKFKHFIPLGFMNQLICFYGGNPEKKLYWKDQLLFTTQNQNAKVLIQLDFEKLTISISIKATKTIKNVTEELTKVFFDIIALYWDDKEYLNSKTIIHDPSKIGAIKLKYSSKNVGLLRGKVNYEKTLDTSRFYTEFNLEIKRNRIKSLIETKPIEDMYLSLNDTNFIKYKELHHIESSTMISYTLDKKEALNFNNPKAIDIVQFKPFTFNPYIKKMKKIFVSYSKKDLSMVNTFLDHLSALKRDGKVGTWYCTELKPADEWDKEIERNFNEADIVCFMVSPNFMKTDYIFKYEIPKAFEQNKKIVPIILDFCDWQTAHNNLGQYNGLPYTVKPIRDFKNENKAWFVVEQCLKILIEEENQSLESEGFFNSFKDENSKQYKNSQLRTIYEQIVEGKADV
ncbi:TIR domain-containing protein [Tenacibaculum sp. 190524A02b]|uniref:TIR domain-containing protein n=1 Tax=Tenacibaculum vairaonense TaxID=3137860 RepID=A0ABM9PR92_9FLAO